MNHPVHSPAHYNKGRIEAIEVIEDVVAGAPEPVVGYLIGQALKYILRAWYKGDQAGPAKSIVVFGTRNYSVVRRRLGNHFGVGSWVFIVMGFRTETFSFDFRYVKFWVGGGLFLLKRRKPFCVTHHQLVCL